MHLLLGFGLLLHLYTALIRSSQVDGFTIGLLIWSWMPYLLIWLIAVRRNRHVRALFPIVFVLTFDLFVHASVFHFAKSSTASLGLLWAPLWNLILIVPLGLVIGLGVERYCSANH